MNEIEQEFQRRVILIPFLGMGLSVDVYCPDLWELWRELQGLNLSIGYLEIFQANRDALFQVRRQFPDLPLAYHAEGLWLTQPDWETAYSSRERLEEIAKDTQTLNALWVNQECASKEMAGYSFGTYLPPLWTKESAEMTGYHTWRAQQDFDGYGWGESGRAPLLLLEGPPLTYFGLGNLSYPEFFAEIAHRTPCGFVLDLGHVWTVYRYTQAWRTQSLERFFEEFLQRFPLERVVQIHIAGLDVHPVAGNPRDGKPDSLLPAWIDAHDAPIPEELLGLLKRVLQEPRLRNLKGLALEVDNKAIPLICRELQMAQELIGDLVAPPPPRASFTLQENLAEQSFGWAPEAGPDLQELLIRQYRSYVNEVTGFGKGLLESSDGSIEISEDVSRGLEVYAQGYLPYELLSWGGALEAMFPQTWKCMEEKGVPVEEFIPFWFSESRSSPRTYDFFLIKVGLFEEFVSKVLPSANGVVQGEARRIREEYQLACQYPVLNG